MSTATAFDTLYLLPYTWDLTADAFGNVALAGPPYSQVQDVASCCRTFYGEVYYDDSLGVQYLQQILGKTPGLNVVQGALVAEALLVPGVESASCVISSFVNGVAVGQVQVVLESGVTITVPIGVSPSTGLPVLVGPPGAPILIGPSGDILIGPS